MTLAQFYQIIDDILLEHGDPSALNTNIVSLGDSVMLTNAQTGDVLGEITIR